MRQVREKTDSRFLDKHLAATQAFEQQMQHYVRKGPELKPIRPEFLAATLSQLAAADAVVDAFALSLPSHVPLHTAKGFTLSVAKQVWNGKLDDVLKTAQRNLGLL